MPKTIDNDLAGTDFTFGFQTAVQIATDAIDRLHTTAESHNRVIVVEVMGRHAGWIAAYSGWPAAPTSILVPEQPFDIDEVCAASAAGTPRARRSPSWSWPRAPRPWTAASSPSSRRIDAFGHSASAVSPSELEREIQERHRLRVAHDDPRPRAARRHPAAYDRVLGSRFGVAAIDAASDGDFGKMVALRGTAVVRVSLDEALAAPKLLDPELWETAEVFFG